MNRKWIIVNGVFIIMLIIMVVIAALNYPRQPQITVQQAKPDREYIRKYPVAGGGYEYILVREFRLNVEFEEEQ